MILDNSSSCAAFRDKIAESQALKIRAENQVRPTALARRSVARTLTPLHRRQLAAILRETALLEDEAAHAEATHEKLKDPFAVAEEVPRTLPRHPRPSLAIPRHLLPSPAIPRLGKPRGDRLPGRIWRSG